MIPEGTVAQVGQGLAIFCLPRRDAGSEILRKSNKRGTSFVTCNCARHGVSLPEEQHPLFHDVSFLCLLREYSQLICKDGWRNEAVLICHICCVLCLQDLSPYSSIHPSFKRALPVFFPISLVTTSFTHLGDLWCLRFYCICDWYAWENKRSDILPALSFKSLA